MKRFFFSIIIIVFSVGLLHAQGVRKTWNGKVNTDWQTEGNWDAVPASGALDEYIFGGHASITVTNMPTIVNAGALIINANVTFSTGSVSANFNVLSPGINFTIATGAGLTIIGSNNFTINIEGGVKAVIDGNLTFIKSSGTASHKLLGTDALAIIFNNGSIFTQNCNGNVFGNSGAKNMVKFLSGSKFIFQSGGNPFGLSQPDSKVIFDTGSLYVHKALSLPSFRNRNYANFEYDNPDNTLHLRNSINNSIIVQIDTITITSGTLSVEPSSIINFNLKGSLIVKPGAAFKIDDTFLGNSQVNFNNINVVQSISVDPSGICTLGSLRVSNNNVLNISNNVSVRDSLIFTSGKINTSHGLLILGENVTNSKVIGASSGQYVEGPVTKTFGSSNEEFIFPLGKKGSPGFVKITPQTSSADFRAEYFKTPAPQIGVQHYSNLMNVSSIEYWEVTGSLHSSALVALAFGPQSGVSDISDIRVACWDEAGTQWKSMGSESWDEINSGYVKTASPVSFSTQILTLGSENGINALPVIFDSFKGNLINETVVLSWTTSNEKNNRTFEVEKSYDGIVFNKIASITPVNGENMSNSYSFNDYEFKEITFYRIKQIDFNGLYLFSNIIRVNVESLSVYQHIIPNPGRENFELILNGPCLEPLTVDLVSSQGTCLEKFRGNQEQVNNWLNSAMSKATAGIYYVKVRLPQAFKTVRLIKN